MPPGSWLAGGPPAELPRRPTRRSRRSAASRLRVLRVDLLVERLEPLVEVLHLPRLVLDREPADQRQVCISCGRDRGRGRVLVVEDLDEGREVLVRLQLLRLRRA